MPSNKMSSSKELAATLRGDGNGRAGQRAGADAGINPPQSPEDVVRTLLLVAPNAGRPPPEIVGCALKAAGLQITDQNLVRALKEAAPPRAPPPTREDIAAAKAAANQYNAADAKAAGASPDTGPVASSSGGSPKGSQSPGAGGLGAAVRAKPPEVAYNGSALPAITFNNAIAQMHTKPVKAIKILESMMRFSPLSANPGLASPLAASAPAAPNSPEEVVQMLVAVNPEGGRPPPNIIGVALRTTGFEATEENLQKALREAAGPGSGPPSREDLAAAREAAGQCEAEEPSGGSGGYPTASSSSSSSSPSKATKSPKSPQSAQAPPEQTPEAVIKALLEVAPTLGQPPPEVVGLCLRQAQVKIDEDAVTRALKAAGDPKPSSWAIRTALASAQEDE